MDDAQPTSTPPQTSSQPAESRRQQNTTNVKETLESILVAFVLAFIFRAFVVEAFVIPTGSMAPTLMGAHMRFQCPDCGYKFDVDYNSGNENNVPPTAGNVPYPIYCPNCGYRVDPSQVTDPPVFYGDRILVLKYLYLLHEPTRWDVVVFKAPPNPQLDNYSINYIKRLVGKPNEAVMVLDGDVYIRPSGAKDPRDFVVQNKPQHVQEALWRLVYDNDFRPQQKLDREPMRSWKLPWTVSDGSGWNLDDPRTHGRSFSFDNSAGASVLAFDPGANATSQTLSDFLVYDTDRLAKQPYNNYPAPDEVPVSDLDLRLTYQRSSGDGPLTLALTKRDHRFVAIITPADATLFDETGGNRRQIGNAFAVSAGSHPIRVELSNADYQVTLRVDGHVVAQTTPAEYAPDLGRLLQEYRARINPPEPRVEIIADRQACQISHVGLWRDVYYYNSPRRVPGITWATPRDFPNNVQQLGPDEYFVMGDNSLVSSDARCWTDPIDLPNENLQVAAGKVPGRFLLGKAFFVYWPAGYKPLSGWPAFVPNFGDMRFIH